MTGHNNIRDISDQVPPGLEYKEEYWDAALEMIEAHEEKAAYRRVAGYLGSVALLLLLLSFIWPYFRNDHALTIDRIAEIDIPDRAVASHLTSVGGASFARSSTSSLSTPSVANMTTELVNLHLSPFADGSSNGSSAIVGGNSDSDPDAAVEGLNSSRESVYNAYTSASANFSAPSSAMSIGTSENQIGLGAIDGRLHDRLSINSDEMDLIPAGRLARDVENAEFNSRPVIDIDPLAGMRRSQCFVSVGYSNLGGYGNSFWQQGAPAQNQEMSDAIDGQRRQQMRSFSNVSIGLGMRYWLNGDWSLEAEMKYYSIAGLNFQQLFNDTCYGTSSQPQILSRSLHVTKMHFVSVPVMIRRNLTDRMTVRAGIGTDVNLGSEFVIEGYYDELEQISACEFVETPGAQRMGKQDVGYLEDLRRVNNYVTAGLTTTLTRRVEITVDYQFGLSDITLGSNFSRDTRDRNSRFSFALQYKL